jgi:PIN domain nuclease of toxin-antitoxin system
VNPILLDTTSLLWFGNRARMNSDAYDAILLAQKDGCIFASAISVWELAFAIRKRHPLRRPDLGGLTARAWFDKIIRELQIDVLSIDTDIASEAADIAPAYGSGDPGDCFVIATAHIHALTLVTRDARILAFAKANPAYPSVIAC